MIRFLAVCALLAGCAAEAPPPPPPAPPVETGVVVQISKTGAPARSLIEELAARCWLDGIVRGAAMIVDRNTGRVIIDSDTEMLLTAEFLPPRDGRSRVRLTGPSADNPKIALKIAKTVDKAERTGETACPIAKG